MWLTPAPAAAGPDHNSSGPAARVPWRSRLSAASLSPDTPQRQAFQLRLTLAAKSRDPARARALLADMAAAGCSPGPREFHAAAAAHALVGDVGGALRVMQDQHSRGGRALFETCVCRTVPPRGCALSSCMPRAATRRSFAPARARGCQTWQRRRRRVRYVAAAPRTQTRTHADGVASHLAAATRAGYDDYASWQLLCNCLFASRASVEAFQAVERGKARGYAPAEDTALHMLRFMAELGLQPEATKLWEQFQAWGLRLSRAHHNAFMETMIYTFGKRDTLQMQILGAAFPEMDTAGVNMALAAMRAHPTQLGDTGEAWNPSVLLRCLESNLAAQGCVPDALTHVLAVDVTCKMGEMELAVLHFRRLAATAEARGTNGTALLSEAQVAALLSRLASQGRGEDLLEVLTACTQDGMRLPDALARPDMHGRTVASRWLAVERGLSADVGMINLRKEREERAARTAAAREERVWRGPRLVMPSLSKMKISELRAEALALGLAVDGARKDVYERVRAARQDIKDGSAPAAMMAAARELFQEDEQEEPQRAASRAEEPRTMDVVMEWGEPVAAPQPGARADGVSMEAMAARIARQASSSGGGGGGHASGPLARVSAWRASRLLPSAALDLGVAVCATMEQLGVQPTQADLICVAREALAAADPVAARGLLAAAAASPAGACLPLYILAAEACVAAGDRLGALRCMDEADLAGHELPDGTLARILSATEASASAGSAADEVRLDAAVALSRVHLASPAARETGAALDAAAWPFGRAAQALV
jgi:hypothetical protein